ncbi:MAG: hypothetical protein KC635_05645 [Myxococcales bacterium]|nr:hypothetical protein [Myxococcales bacterium]MCB9733330.1 hypothetical protein [Deltaproteobacteria bacterium]
MLTAILTAWLIAAAPLPPGVSLRAETTHFRVYGSDAVATAAERLAPEAEGRLDAVCQRLGACHVLSGKVDVFVAEDPEAFAASLPPGSPMAEWASGVAFPAERRVVLRAHGSALFSFLQTFDHELAHVLLHGLAGGNPYPRWVTEGLAIWASGEGLMERLASANRAAVLGNLLPFDELDRRFPNKGPNVEIAYAQSALFVHTLVGRFGAGALPQVLREVGRGARFDDAFEARFGGAPDSLGDLWSRDLERDSSPLMLFQDGSAFWVLMTLLFVYAAWRQQRDRQRQMEAMDGPEQDPAALAAFEELETQRREGEAPTLH